LPIPVAIEKQMDGKVRSNSSNNEQSFFMASIFASVLTLSMRLALTIRESNNSRLCLSGSLKLKVLLIKSVVLLIVLFI